MRWPFGRVAVAERSMEPALRDGDWLIVWRGLRAARPIRVRPGQVVIAEEPGGWWLESDNHGVPAVDSRRFGPVAAQHIVGRVVLRYWPARHRSE
jgi:signal peptidase I